MRTYLIEPRNLAEQPVAVCRATLPVADIGPWLAQVLATVAQALAVAGAGPRGMPFARYHARDDGTFDIEAGFPASRAIDPAGEVTAATLPAGPAAHTVHVGPYDEMQPAYEALEAWIRERGGKPDGDPWEVYLSDPGAEPDPSSWRTEVFAPFAEP
jgi:effector-binding domain-containing protein